MNKVISIHLCGVAFQLEENGYEALRAYLEKAGHQLSANPDKAEILTDIERAIADKFRALLSSGRNVVLSAEVEAVIKEMGPVTDDAAEPAASKTEPKTSTNSSSQEPPPAFSPQPKRLYRLKEGGMIGGVCNGLAAYIGIDVTLLRLVVAILVFFSFGTVAIAYIVGMIIIPTAETAEQKSAASGPAPTAQEFIRRAKEGYYEGFKTFGDRQAHRHWKRKFKNEMREWKQRVREEYRWSWRHGVPPTPPPAPMPSTAAVPPSTPPPGSMHVVMPVLATLHSVLVLFTWFVAISLLATGRIFGLELPWGLPVWAGIVLLFIGCKFATAPIKALKRYYYYRANGWPTYWSPYTEIWGILLTILIIVAFFWFAIACIPGFSDALRHIPIFLQNVTDSIRQWWSNK